MTPDTTGGPGDECAGCGTDLDDRPAWESTSGLLCQTCAVLAEEE